MHSESSEDSALASQPTVQSLQSKEHRALLDSIDKLRSQGISRYVNLPQIIVCGDQSSGKSSVLEAISGLSFPTKDNLCTRFATELILRRNPTSAIHISIVPENDRSEAEKENLQKFGFSSPADFPSLDQVVENAKEAMGLSSPGSGKVFSTDVLRIELSGPQQPHLTMVDLPGLFEAGNSDQSDEDAEMVKSLVLSYMESPRSIILAVVSAHNDFALQGVTKHARKLDPEGMRTLGLITKPDQLHEGSDSERAYITLAQNKDVKFRLGWHVLRNRGYPERAASTAERNRIELEFFSNGVWATVDPGHVGVSPLKPRLSHILRDQILVQLPNVQADVEAGINECKARLEKLGASRATLTEQRQYLLHISHTFYKNVKAAVGGMYDEPFFGASKTDEGYRRRLRAVVQNTLLAFADEMRLNGCFLKIVDEITSDEPRLISRSQYAEKVKESMVRNRGRELPGTYNPLIVSELFREQCIPWRDVITRFTREVVDASHFSVNSALEDAADGITAVGLLREIITPGLNQLKISLKEKIEEILKPHESGHPITYNHYLTENVQKARAKRQKEGLECVLKEFFGSVTHYSGLYDVDVQGLLSELVKSNEADMDRYASYAAIDMMEAYYKVTLKKVVDDISVLAIERCLIEHLPALLSPETVYGLADEVVHRIAAESEESTAERERLVERLRVLESGLQNLNRLNNHSGKPRAVVETAGKFSTFCEDGEPPKSPDADAELAPPAAEPPLFTEPEPEPEEIQDFFPSFGQAHSSSSTIKKKKTKKKSVF